ncbi:hypothetical protein JOD54_005562 [Actinokineospora baliensis]|nr:hypothetical protein [Actinokineospora baliensis]
MRGVAANPSESHPLGWARDASSGACRAGGGVVGRTAWVGAGPICATPARPNSGHRSCCTDGSRDPIAVSSGSAGAGSRPEVRPCVGLRRTCRSPIHSAGLGIPVWELAERVAGWVVAPRGSGRARSGATPARPNSGHRSCWTDGSCDRSRLLPARSGREPTGGATRAWGCGEPVGVPSHSAGLGMPVREPAEQVAAWLAARVGAGPICATPARPNSGPGPAALTARVTRSRLLSARPWWAMRPEWDRLCVGSLERVGRWGD